MALKQEEIEAIRRHIAPTVHRFARRFKDLGFVYEDVEQEAMILSLQFLDEGKSFNLLRNMLRWRLFNVMHRYDLNLRRKGTCTTVAFSSFGWHKQNLSYYDWVPYVIDPCCERLEEERDARELVDYYIARSGMSRRDRSIVKRYSQGATLKEAGAEFGVSESWACIVLSQFKQTCRQIEGLECT